MVLQTEDPINSCPGFPSRSIKFEYSLDGTTINLHSDLIMKDITSGFDGTTTFNQQGTYPWNNTNSGHFSGDFAKDEFRWNGTKWYYFKTYPKL